MQHYVYNVTFIYIMYFVLSYKIPPHPPPDIFAPCTDLSPRFFDFHFSIFAFIPCNNRWPITKGHEIDMRKSFISENIWVFQLFFILLHHKNIGVVSAPWIAVPWVTTTPIFLYLIFFEVFFCCLEKYTYLCSAG